MGLFDRFKRATLEVPELGTLERRRGVWLGSMPLGASTSVPLELAGPREGVPEVRLRLARELIARYDSLRPSIQEGLYDHYKPYLEAPDDDAVPAIDSASEIWGHVAIAHVRIEPLAGIETVEIGFDTTWDVEHTPAARFQNWQLVDLNGSVPGVY
ncbi:MAG TPA: hypothetical protein VFT12_03285 [Thermoanaerobaculia bacterium]|nr:hypothetical protein [Thermoanaerobaculia bacterium]